jgi:hypothetical protein
VFHCIRSLQRVRVQACFTASGARDMVRIHWCPQSRRAGKGVDEEKEEEEEEEQLHLY